MIVEKAVKMANMMDVPIYGIVENMSYYTCPDCGKKHSIYGESHIEEVAKRFDIGRIAKLPIDSEIARKCDAGDIESYDAPALSDFTSEL